ncbi:Ring finger domain-containing protein isoform 2 [Cladophialophora immunda]|nr:Ring finger domain-containing protein isoform 2 [Cladophialophora immunda]
MGNASSAPRTQADDGLMEELRDTPTGVGTAVGGTRAEGRSSRLARRNTQSLRLAGQRASTLYDSFRRHRSAESVTSRPNAGHSSSSPSETEYEQENRPLVGVEDVDMPDADAIARPMLSPSSNRRRSTMSRLGSRLLPDSVARGLLNSGEETAEEGRALRHGISGRLRPSVYERPPNSDSNSRVSLTGSIRRRGETRTESRRRAIRGPFPALQSVHQTPESSNSWSESMDGDLRELPQPAASGLRHRNRFSRVRDSMSISQRISSLFRQSTEQLQSSQGGRESPSRPARVTFADESDHLLPSIASADHRHEHDDAPHELDAVEPEARTLLAGPRVTSGMSTIRRFQPGLRSRSTRLIRRGEHPPLSQVLQLAAAAIAAQLSGHATAGSTGARHLGGDTFDGSIQNFVQTLQEAATAQAGENIDVNAADGDLPPVNFMRVFQFPNDENGSPIASQAESRDVDQMDLDSIAGPSESDRSVTLVLVGVRSLPHGQDSTGGENGTLGPSLDTLLSLPFLPPANVLRNGSSGALFRRSDVRNRSSTRRHSMTNFSFPAQYESQRHQRTRTQTSRLSSHSDQTAPTTPDAGSSTLVSETPPGPIPPPSTPADIRSGHATPIRRPSSASAAPNQALSELDEDRPQEHADSRAPEPSFNTARQRRRSDSEFARRPELGSGAARRNGVVEPDHPPAGAGRSWLIYVMLSTLLGPVKPPVATQEDVSAAGGVFRLVVQESGFLGETISDGDNSPLVINLGERCLICLSDYAASEEVRLLDKCKHVYHRECIDEWLTTGRNSCPMCRGQGVQEKGTSSPSTTNAGSASSTTT